MAEEGRRQGLPERNLIKNELVLAAGLQSLERAHQAGIRAGWSTDLIGELQVRQREEFALRAEVVSAATILHSMYVINPQILNRVDSIGRLAPGTSHAERRGHYADQSP